MYKFIGIFLFISLFGGFSSLAQAKKNDLIISQDSVKTNKRKEINPLAPAKAAFYSAILPGLGQAYNKSYWKIPLVYGGIGSGIYFYSRNNTKYHEFRNEYKKRLNGTSNPADPLYGNLDNDRLIAGQRFYQRNRDLSVIVIAAFYILNIVDANVDAHLIQFNVDNELTLSPNIQQNEIDYKHSVGLSLNYKF